ncbi:TOTE conflict system archaeo-eukaryotic primase domain-containing protein [Dictyobacter arantiisoli]|uniref:TOTE conflict system primase domain-containing protein n=1 Tax=Dictyobacter arantiisoli TaxID=2014874 RepID=A0A5A5T8I2_9CHLR|nr:hypothetical protein [Dictyobacter arantiisoli]GCF07353.1 hypothetical protein KDI_09170 [Dictyobacter arantiisoli]
MAITTYLSTYMDLFVGRHDDYAIQLSNGRYRRAKQPLTKHDIHDHLLGVRTYGTYIMDAAGRCRFAVIDADTDDGLDRLWSIQEQLATHGIVSSVERSRRGGHLWVFFTDPVPASQVRAWLLRYCPSDMEFYPKQDEGKGYGSLIRLPLGVHRKSGQRYPFVERGSTGLVALTLTDEQRIAWFSSIKRMEVPQLVTTPAPAASTSHTLFSSPPQRAAQGPSPIRQWNAEQDHYEVIGRYVSLNNNGVGQCPFGDHHTNGSDTKASFKVYNPGVPGGYCWYCYTWQKGGSLFDFLRYYYHLDTQELWERIRSEEIQS